MITTNPKSTFSIIHWNCNGMKSSNKIEELKHYLSAEQPEVLMLNEIKCSSEQSNLCLNFKGYKVYSKPRNSFGGGVAILVKSDIISNQMYHLQNRIEEIIGVKIKVKLKNGSSKEFTLISIYNPPNTELDVELFMDISNESNNVIIMGDLNAKLDCQSCVAGKSLREILENSKLLILNCGQEPTFERIDQINDKIISSKLDYALAGPEIYNLNHECGILNSNFLKSDHKPIEIKINLDKSEVTSESVTSFNYKKANWDKFQLELNRIQPELISTNNIDQGGEHLINTLQTAIHNAIPTVKSKVFTLLKPALPEHILTLIRLRDIKYVRYKKKRNAQNRIDYYNFVNKIESEILKIKDEEWRKILIKLGPTPLSTKFIWNKVNLAQNKKQKSSIPTLVVNGAQLETDEDKASAFANKLWNTFNEDKNDKDAYDNSHKIKIESAVNNFLRKNEKFKCNIAISKAELDQALKSINNKKTLDVYGISNFIIKRINDKFKAALLLFYNRCFNEHSNPKEWKSSLINMLGKKGDPHSINNYRPISSTPILMKVLERIMYNKISKFLKENNIIIKQQSGFRANRQTKDNLIFITQKAHEAILKGNKLCAILFDIKGAFDKVWHKGLIFKLMLIKAPTMIINWLNDFLTNRSFSVKVNNYETTKYEIGCGVPQGAVLSPILFSIFINDIPLNNIKRKQNSLLFADDLAYLHQLKAINSRAEKLINKHLESLEIWLKKWRLTMATNKCNYILFSRNKKNRASEILNLKLYNDHINKANEVQFLGITFDSYLSFNSNVAMVRKKCLNRLNLIKILSGKRWQLNENTLVSLQKSLEQSLIDYSIFTWPLLSNANKAKLQAIQNNSIRIIFKLDKTVALNEFRSNSNIMKLEDRYTDLMGRYYRKCYENSNELIASLIEEADSVIKSLCWRTFGTEEPIHLVIGKIINGSFEPP